MEDHDITSTRTSVELGSSQYYRFILLSPSDMTHPVTASRIEQLYLCESGQNAAIIFLVDEDNTEDAMQAFMRLQAELSHRLFL